MTEASSYDVATDRWAYLSYWFFPCRGMALSLAVMVRGMLGFRKDSNISGILSKPGIRDALSKDETDDRNRTWRRRGIRSL